MMDLERHKRISSSSNFENISIATRRHTRTSHKLDNFLYDFVENEKVLECIPCSSCEAALFIETLRKGVTKLQVLKCKDKLKITEAPNFMESYFAKDLPRKRIFDRESLETTSIAQKSYGQRQVQQERSLITEILLHCINDLTKNCTYISLIENIWHLNLREKEYNSIITNASNRNKELDDLQMEIMHLKSMNHIEKNRLYKTKKQLQNNIHDNIIKHDTELRFTEKYESSRREQLKLFVIQAENSCKKSTKKSRHEGFVDIRVHDEIVKYLSNQITKFSKEIVAWSEKYDTEIEVLDTELLRKKEWNDQLKKNIDELRKKYDANNEEIEEYLQVKGARDLLAKKNNMSICLQKWWRGEIFRKKLITKKKKGGGRKK